MANKKINQLVAKTTIQSTDLFPLGDPTTGQLFKKTVADLQAAIGGAVISVNGLTGALVLDTDDIQELASPTNRYFTEARARAAISLTTTGSSGASTYSSSTGVLNVPTYTLAGLGGITASFLSGGTGITYNSGTGVISYSGTVYTDASIRALFSAGTGLSYNSSTGAFTNTAPDQTVAIAGGTGISVTGTYPSFTVAFTGTIYTDSSIRGLFSGTAPITFNASTGAIGITQATTSTNGYLSTTDWNTFNGKQSALTIGNLTEATSSVLTITGGTGAVIGSGTSIQVKQASSTVSGFLSSTDWSTFNSKQGTITLTTTGTSGAATFSGGTLNIPQYQAALTNPVTGTGTSGKLVKFTGTSSIGDSILTESSGVITQSATLPDYSLNYTDATSYGRLFFSESNTFKAAIQFMGSSFAATARRNALEIVNTTTGDLALGTGDARTFYIKNGGNVGIGLISPSAVLHVVKDGAGNSNTSITGSQLILSRTSAAGENLAFRNTGTSNGINGTNYTAQILSDGNNVLEMYTTGALPLVFGTNATERMRITSAGHIGVGTNSPTPLGTGYTTIDIRGTSGGGLYFGTSTSASFLYGDGGSYDFGTTTAIGIRIYTNNTQRMAFTSGGNILMGTTSDNGERLYVSGSIRATGSITANSDARLKKNIERIENALEKVEQISGYTYNTIYDEDRHAGVIAQEIDKVLPEIVNKGNDGLMGVEYGNISALLIEAIKDLKKDNESLKAIVEGLRK